MKNPGTPALLRSRYLRLSLTNQCNFNCYYCHNEGQDKSRKPSLLSEDDIVWICGTASKRGFRKFKLTGGEPTLRKDLGSLLIRLRELELDDLSIITNGSRLAETLPDLKIAGLPRLNVTLNTINTKKFRRYVHRDERKLYRVLAGIDMAIESGYTDMKLNFVYHGPQSLDDFRDICHYASDRNLIVVMLPMLMINPKHDDLETSLSQLHVMCEALGVRRKELITDNEGLQKQLITLKSGARILLRLDELGMRYPYKSCELCSDRNECREGIFPVRISADGYLIPCLAGGRNHVDLKKIIKERNESVLMRAIGLTEN